MADRLGDEFEFRQITYKPYPTCQFHRAVVSGVLALRRQAPRASLRRLTIHMHPFEADFIGVRHAGPFRRFSQTFMSAPFCAALAWVDGCVGYEGMHRYDDTRVLELAARIDVVSDPGIERYRPRLVAMDDHGVAREWAEQGGSEAYLLTWHAAVDMSGALCEEVGVPAPAAQALADAADALARAPSASALLAGGRNGHRAGRAATVQSGHASRPDTRTRHDRVRHTTRETINHAQENEKLRRGPGRMGRRVDGGGAMRRRARPGAG
ncbi:MmgE/PrpD family protein [Achromobacter sp. DMS1]|uniref:MmgE/PrpD family protein n=1 Tax=Achromobacter sp. DMS1 TaxID=1688405 RepID=UPI00069FC79A|nr:MmgE/PrpD family protein [Achromobacter sp. DMS1]